MPGYVPVALRGGELQTASTDGESVDAYYDERTREFSNGETITYWVADNMVVEGDMILFDDAEEFEALLDEYEAYLSAQEEGTLAPQAVFANPHCKLRGFAIGPFCIIYSNDGRRWPGGLVYYDRDSIYDNFTSSQRSNIFKAMSDIRKATNSEVRFASRSSGDRIVFKRKANAGCYSRLGYVGGAQTLMLSDFPDGPGCADDLGTIIHELGHAVGLLHEHQRCDRDSYIDVNEDNLRGKGPSAFAKRCHNKAKYSSFDYLSIMMYPTTTDSTSFVHNPSIPMFTVDSGRTLPINPETGRRLTERQIGRLDYLSSRDIAGLKARY